MSKYWIQSVLDAEGEPDKEVVIVDENDVVVARGGLQVEWPGITAIDPASHEVMASVRFVGKAIE